MHGGVRQQPASPEGPSRHLQPRYQYDPEGLAYIGNGRFVMVEELDRLASVFTYMTGGTLRGRTLKA